MRKLGFDETWFDSMGNTVGRIGSGPRVLVYDSHIDTVGIGNPDEWDWVPFIGKIDKGRLYARGACDEKGSTPPMIYGLALAHKLCRGGGQRLAVGGGVAGAGVGRARPLAAHRLVTLGAAARAHKQ